MVVRDWRGHRLYEGCRVVFAYNGRLEEGEITHVHEVGWIDIEFLNSDPLDRHVITMHTDSRITKVDAPYGPLGHGSDVAERFLP